MRRNRRALVIAAAATSLAVVPANAGAQQEPPPAPLVIDTSLGYTCGEAGPVTLRVTATLPPTAVVGEPVEASDVGLEVTVPAAVLAGLPGAASATAVTRLDVAPETWAAVQTEPVPLADPVVLGGTVTAPPVTPLPAAGLTFAAGDLTVEVTGYTADGVPTEPPAVSLTCVLDEGEAAVLAVVPVEAPTPGRAPAPVEPGQPDRDVPAAGAPSVAKAPPPECYRLPDVPPEFRAPFCAKVNGRANVAKLDAAVAQPTGMVNITATNLLINKCPEKPPVGCQDARVSPELNGEPKYPPATGSFFAFGFMPATGTMQLTQIGYADVHQWSKLVPIPGQPGEYEGLTTVKVKLSAQILEATVNGVPVPLGPGCRSAEPIDAVFTASYSGPDKYSISNGGPLMGTVTIPPFSGCGTTEDLDPILTGLISGPGNFVRLYQGAVCTITGNNFGCDPIEEPVDPKYPPT